MQLHQSKIKKNKLPFLTKQHPSISPIIEDAIVIDDPRVINRLMNNLMYMFNIQDGDYLTFVLGQGQCTNNRDAIKYWILAELTDKSISQDDVLEYLVVKLKERIAMEVCQ